MESLPVRPAKPASNEPHNLLARLYREIGVSAVATALQVSDVEDAAGPLEVIAGPDTAVIAAPTADKAA